MRDRLASFGWFSQSPAPPLFSLLHGEGVVTRCRGSSLIELVVALLLLELAGAAALAAALSADRLGRLAGRGGAVDIWRWEEYRRAETASPCRSESVPRQATVLFPTTMDRESLSVVVRCGP